MSGPHCAVVDVVDYITYTRSHWLWNVRS